ncbi:glycosyltransferase [Cyanobium sp. CH-040]|uniref:glycosyltransferase n=1 Tax=Cyanobium sp. CH-040 TaxID=2823708 RepID=UPI0020CDF399|nr:glycosyltransferase [Cyanobium sp. CH-040]MCP9928214.1 glycosyltransferase [Cyanobium sp. CH-040]
MQVLFIHQNFPGQYRHLAAALRQRGDRVVAIGGPTARGLEGVELHRYDPMPAGGVPDCHSWAADFQAKTIRAEAVARLLEGLVADGLRPDLVVGHPGWGELLAVKDVLPGVPVLHQVEFVYQLQGGDLGFDPEFPAEGWRARSRTRLKRATQLLAFHDLDWGLAPTRWQAATAPVQFRDRISVIHEGIDSDRIAPRPGSRIQLQKAGLTFHPGDELVSFVARNLEPYRGFHRFLRCLPELQRLRPKAHVLLVGGDGVSYGAPPAGGGSWRQVLLQELEGRLDLSRIHFVGRIPHAVLHDLFRVCACHVYLTYPFVLSWSLLEAMACGAVVVGSATAPVQEVIRDGENGLLVDFFDGEALAATIAGVLADPGTHRPLGLAARRSVVERYDLHSVCLPRQLQLVDALAAGRTPG